MSIEVTLLGSFRVSVDGTELVRLPDRPMRAALLAYLATEREASRQSVITDFQKRGEDPVKTRHRLNQTLHVLRGDLDEAAEGGRAEWVSSRGDVLIVSERLRTDVQAFRAAVAGADHDTALRVYRGEFLTGRDSLKGAPNYEPWVSRVRDQLRRTHQTVSLDTIETAAAQGDLDRAIEVARRWVDLDPLDDRGQDQLIRLLVEAGRRREALQQYFAYEESTWRAFGDAPWESTRLLIESLEVRPTSVDELRERDEAEAEALGVTPNSLVVSWFETEGDDAESGPRTSGLVRRIQDALSHYDELSVLPITATLYLKDNPTAPEEVGPRLSVAWSLTATVTPGADTLDLSATLRRARDGKSWQSTFRASNPEEEYTLHREIGHWVVSTVVGAIEGEGEAAAAARRARKARAMSLFDVAYSGYEDRSREGFEMAADRLQEALEIEPNFARAHAKLADVLIAQAQFGFCRPRDVMPRALEAANRALEVDPDQWEAFAARAHVRDTFEWNWEGAEADYLRALQLNPEDFNARTWYADMLTAIGRGRESRVQIRGAEQAHPLSPAVQWSKGGQHYRAGRFPQAIDSLNRALFLKPGYTIALVFRAFTRTALGEAAAAAEEMEAVRAANPHPIPIVELAIGVARAALGDDPAATECLARIEAVSRVAYVPAAIRAIMLGQLGRLDEAFEELEVAAEERWGQLIYLAVDPVYAPLRADPRYESFARRLRVG